MSESWIVVRVGNSLAAPSSGARVSWSVYLPPLRIALLFMQLLSPLIFECFVEKSAAKYAILDPETPLGGPHIRPIRKPIWLLFDWTSYSIESNVFSNVYLANVCYFANVIREACIAITSIIFDCKQCSHVI